MDTETPTTTTTWSIKWTHDDCDYRLRPPGEFGDLQWKFVDEPEERFSNLDRTSTIKALVAELLRAYSMLADGGAS